jgi:hypothetical protein
LSVRRASASSVSTPVDRPSETPSRSPNRAPRAPLGWETAS